MRDFGEEYRGLLYAPAEARLLQYVPLVRRGSFRKDALIADSDHTDDIIVVLSGVVRVSLCAADGRERVLANLPKGSMVGEQRVLAGVPLEVNLAIFAETPCDIGYLRGGDVLHALAAHPDLLKELLVSMRLKTKLYLDELGRAAFEHTLSQVSALLLTLDPGRGKVDISQERLARLSGKSRRTVAAQLHHLAAVGAIHLGRSTIKIEDRAVLARLAESG